jgi:hypothetical protein
MLTSVAARYWFTTKATHATFFTRNLSLLARGATHFDFHAVLVSCKFPFHNFVVLNCLTVQNYDAIMRLKTLNSIAFPIAFKKAV